MELKDRINAVIRTPEYKKAFDQCHKSANSGTQRRFTLSGHHLHLQPLSPAFHKLCIDFKTPLPFSPHSPIVLEEFPAAFAVSRMEDGKCLVGTDEDLCLHVKIDMTQPLGAIQDEIKRLYEENKVKGLSDSRNKDSEIACSIWEVYDLVTRDGLTTYQLAQKFGMTGVPKEGNYDDDAIYSRYKRAYIKAKKIVDKVRRGFL